MFTMICFNFAKVKYAKCTRKIRKISLFQTLAGTEECDNTKHYVYQIMNS